jgi:hypothetical protein
MRIARSFLAAALVLCTGSAAAQHLPLPGVAGPAEGPVRIDPLLRAAAPGSPGSPRSRCSAPWA